MGAGAWLTVDYCHAGLGEIRDSSHIAWITWAHHEPFFPDAQRNEDRRTVSHNPPHKGDVVLGTVRIIEMRASGVDLAARQALQRRRTVGCEPVDPQARMPAL